MILFLDQNRAAARKLQIAAASDLAVANSLATWSSVSRKQTHLGHAIQIQRKYTLLDTA